MESKGIDITIWDANQSYDKGDLVLYFKQERKQTSAEQGKREFVFILMSNKNGNTNTPNYDIVDHIPDFTKSAWTLLNPLSYLLQNLDEMRQVVVEVFKELLEKHVREQHGLVGSEEIANNLVMKDYTNLQTPWQVGKYSLWNSSQNIEDTNNGITGRMQKSTNGLMEYDLQYSFDR